MVRSTGSVRGVRVREVTVVADMSTLTGQEGERCGTLWAASRVWGRYLVRMGTSQSVPTVHTPHSWPDSITGLYYVMFMREREQ